MTCEICGRADATKLDLWFTGPASMVEGPFGPVLNGQSASATRYLCGRSECETKAARQGMASLGAGWARQKRLTDEERAELHKRLGLPKAASP